MCALPMIDKLLQKLPYIGDRTNFQCKNARIHNYPVEYNYILFVLLDVLAKLPSQPTFEWKKLYEQYVIDEITHAQKRTIYNQEKMMEVQ